MNKFLAELIRGSHADLLMVRVGTALLLGKFGITGSMADVLGFFVRRVIGLFIGYGVFGLDLTADAWRESLTLTEYKKLIYPAYQKARARLYTDEEKDAIRKEFLDISRKLVRVGVRPQPSPGRPDF